MNIKKLMQNKNNIFFSWLVSYILILIIPIFIGLFTYTISIRVITGEVNKVNDTSLEQFKTAIDDKFEEINRISNVIAFNDKIKKILYINKSIEGIDYISLMEIQSELARYKLSNSFIDNIYLYFKSSNFILTDSYKYQEWEYEGVGRNTLNIDVSKFINEMNTNHIRDYKIVKKKNDKGKESSDVIFLQSMYLTDYSSPAGTLMIVIDQEKLSHILQTQKWTKQGNVMTINSNNEFLDSGESSILPDFLGYKHLNNNKGTFNIDYLNTNMTVSYSNSSVTEWKYVSVLPTKVFLEKVQYIKMLIWGYILLCLIIGSILAYIFTKRNYSPIKKLIQVFSERVGRLGGGEYDEFKFLQTSLNKLIDENENINSRLKQQGEAIRNNFLMRLLKGRFLNIGSVKSELEANSIRFDNENYIVMSFTIEKLNNDILDQNVNQGEEAVNLIYFIIKNVVEELVNEQYLGYMAEVDGMQVCLINIPQSSIEMEKVMEDMSQIASKAIDFIEKKFDISLTAAISNIHRFLKGISKAYSETLETYEYKKLTENTDKIILYGSLHSDAGNNIGDNYNLEKERQFINCILAEDYKSAASILDDIINDLVQNIQSFQLIKCRMFGIINSMLNAMGEIKNSIDEKFFEELDPVNKLIMSKSINELKTQVNYIFEQIAMYYAQISKKQEPEWILQVEDYVRKNYSEINLSVENISQQFNISFSHLSRTYKKYRGIGLLDYVHKIRLQEAKKLMNSDISIKDIAERVGYLESKAMIRAFKKYEGITPGRFREME